MRFETRRGWLARAGLALAASAGLGAALAAGSAATTASAAPRGAETSPAPAEEPTEAQLGEARALARRFSQRLKGALQSALQEGGPEAAIEVCREQAPSIAGELSREGDWAVGRTALRVRNPRNAPSVRERAVLMRFLQRAEAGEDLSGLEHAAILGEGEDRLLHYMKAIPTGGVCLTCHGQSIAPGVKDAIRASYPADAATGFEAGELRGAFTFVRPLAVQTGDAGQKGQSGRTEQSGRPGDKER
ncbi:MAG: Tll0287-like domain-containing protein [bacterium]